MNIVCKVCSTCKNSLPISEFYVKDKRTGRKFSWCRTCHAIKNGRNPKGIIPRRWPAEDVSEVGICQLCKQESPRSDFTHKGSYCSKCRSRDPREVYRENQLRFKAIHGAEYDRDKNRRWRKRNPEKLSSMGKKFRKLYPEKVREAARRWRHKYPEKSTAVTARRRASRLAAEGTYTGDEWIKVKLRYGNRCLRCLRPESIVKLTADHVMPLTRGGSNWPSNLQPLCQSCNSIKKDKFIEFRPDRLLAS